MLIPHGALILVIDAGALRLFRNGGTDTAPRLDLLDHRTNDLDAAHVFAGGRPVRVFESVGVARHAVEGPDLRRRREEDFASAACEMLLTHGGGEHPLIVIAPPRMLGALRGHYPRHLSRPPFAELDKDWTHHPPAEVTRLLHRHLD